MNIKERDRLLAEKTSLERMLTNLPESSVIDRMSLKSRKAKVEQELTNTDETEILGGVSMNYVLETPNYNLADYITKSTYAFSPFDNIDLTAKIGDVPKYVTVNVTIYGRPFKAVYLNNGQPFFKDGDALEDYKLDDPKFWILDTPENNELILNPNSIENEFKLKKHQPPYADFLGFSERFANQICITCKGIGENERVRELQKLSNFVKENWNVLYEGATRLSKNYSNAIKTISEDYWAPQRIQFGDTRFHQIVGVKIADGWHYRRNSATELTDYNIRTVASQLQQLFDAAAEETPCSVEIIIQNKDVKYLWKN